MKRLIISAAIIVLLIGLSTVHVRHLEHMTDELIEKLENVSISINSGNWSAARKSLATVSARWESHAFYLHTTLRHADTDTILTTMKELEAYLNSREDRAESMSVVAKLINQLELLLEAEQPTIKNLL